MGQLARNDLFNLLARRWIGARKVPMHFTVAENAMQSVSILLCELDFRPFGLLGPNYIDSVS
jgi:hypothetical protein